MIDLIIVHIKEDKKLFVERGKPNIINKRRGFRGKRGYY